MSWTTFQDITDRWVGPGVPDDSDLVAALIVDAEAVILYEYPRIQERIDAETLPLSTVVLVVVRMVSRQLRNPEGVTYRQQTTGPFGQALNYGSTPQDVWLTPDEKKLLAPKRKGKAFSVDLGANAGLHSVARLTEAQLIAGEVNGLVKDAE